MQFPYACKAMKCVSIEASLVFCFFFISVPYQSSPFTWKVTLREMWFGTGTLSKTKADASWGKCNLSFLHINFINYMIFLLLENI